MLKLYFGNANATISTLLAAAFAVFFALVTKNRAGITHWGILTLVMFFLGLAMSIMSGMKDGMGTAASIMPNTHWVTIVLMAAGGLGFLSGLLALIIRNQAYWQASFYILSSIIILKIIVTETYRIIHFLGK